MMIFATVAGLVITFGPCIYGLVVIVNELNRQKKEIR